MAEMGKEPRKQKGDELSPPAFVEVPRELVEVVKAAVRAHREVPGSVALGGTVCSLYSHHRVSTDIDFAVSDLRTRFQEVREHLFTLPGWQEARVRVPLLILGSLDGVEVGYRQVRREAPLETPEILTPEGPLTIPTLDELLRVKAFLVYDRNYTRDFVDFAELSCLRDQKDVAEALLLLDEKYRWEKQPSIVVEVVKTLLNPAPHDRETNGFETLRLLEPKLATWEEVQTRCGTSDVSSRSASSGRRNNGPQKHHHNRLDEDGN